MKYIGFLSNTGPEPLKNQASIQCWAIIDPQVNDDGPLLVVSGSFLPHYLKKEDAVRIGPPLAKLSGSAPGCNVCLKTLLWQCILKPVFALIYFTNSRESLGGLLYLIGTHFKRVGYAYSVDIMRLIIE